MLILNTTTTTATTTTATTTTTTTTTTTNSDNNSSKAIVHFEHDTDKLNDGSAVLSSAKGSAYLYGCFPECETMHLSSAMILSLFQTSKIHHFCR